MLDVYGGADGGTTLVEDDDRTEEYRTLGKKTTTAIRYRDADTSIHIGAVRGDYAGAPLQRAYEITLHGVLASSCFTVNGKPAEVHVGADGITQIVVPRMPVGREVMVAACAAR